MSHTKLPVSRLVTVMGLVLALPIVMQQAASQGNTKPRPIFVLMYVDRDFPKEWIALSKHEDHAKAVEAMNRLAKIKGILCVAVVPVDPVTGKQAPWPSDVKRPDLRKGKAPDLPKELPARKDICVRVYKHGVEHPGYKLEAKADYDRAKEYFDRINKTRRWKATWDAPGWPRPDIKVLKSQWIDIGPYTTICVISLIGPGIDPNNPTVLWQVAVNGKWSATMECIPGTPICIGDRIHVPKDCSLLFGGR